jgi:hypothetical protein
MILPPDPVAPEAVRRHRFPPQGPALVAASLAPDGYRVTVRDLELDLALDPKGLPLALLDDEVRIDAHLAGAPDPALEALTEGLVALLGEAPAEVVAFSLERHSQGPVTALLARALGRSRGVPTVVGGPSTRALLGHLRALGARGTGALTDASTPDEIRAVFEALTAARPDPEALPWDPLRAPLPTDPDAWPVPDFSIYDLDRYRRDPVAAEGERFPGYDGAVGAVLVLPYHFTFDCQFACAFCQRGGRQSAKSIERAVRDLAALAERHDTRHFFLVDAQVNLYAGALAEALHAARLGLTWSDSYRVMPHHPGELERMAQAGCRGLTFGVESASDRVLKAMVKGHRQRHATRALREAHNAGIYTRVNLLTCYPGETREDQQETLRWLEAHADAVDELAPSSFYLAPGSPLERDPARYGIRVRGPRVVAGDYRFRKVHGALAYDELHGLPWEAREATLRPSEAELLDTWERARGTLSPVGPLRGPTMLALGSFFTNKSNALQYLLRATDGPSRRPPPAASGPVAPPRMLPPMHRDEHLERRFREALTDATPALVSHLGGRLSGHLLLFSDGDYLCFQGEVVGDRSRTVKLTAVLAWRFERATAGRALYGRLVPGARFTVGPEGLTLEGEPGVWPGLRGEDVTLLGFAPEAPDAVWGTI